MVRTMQTGMETYYTDFNTYSTATLAGLNTIENQIPTGAACGGTAAANTPRIGAAGTTSCTSAAPGGTNYCIGLDSTSGRTFLLHRTDAGVISRPCGEGAGGTAGQPTGNGGGCPAGTW
mgnify:CR=1 FL=1